MASNFFACEYCGRLFGSGKAQCDHEYWCPENPDCQVLGRRPGAADIVGVPVTPTDS
jgi:hypothetical protein